MWICVNRKLVGGDLFSVSSKYFILNLLVRNALTFTLVRRMKLRALTECESSNWIQELQFRNRNKEREVAYRIKSIYGVGTHTHKNGHTLNRVIHQKIFICNENDSVFVAFMKRDFDFVASWSDIRILGNPNMIFFVRCDLARVDGYISFKCLLFDYYFSCELDEKYKQNTSDSYKKSNKLRRWHFLAVFWRQ